MTWYASQIITTGTPAVIAAIESNPLFTDHVFRVTNPIQHDWHSPKVKHSVPDEGLVFIRPICDPADYISEWHGDEALSWGRFEKAPGLDVTLTPHAIAERHVEVEADAFPAADILRVAKKLNADTNVPVAFYYCFFWGGEVEVEYAWIFDGSERVLIRLTEDVPPTINRLIEINLNNETVIDDDVLVRALRFLSCDLPTPFFAPHTRSFPWDQHYFNRRNME